jgi:hypothetical protein
MSAGRWATAKSSADSTEAAQQHGADQPAPEGDKKEPEEDLFANAGCDRRHQRGREGRMHQPPHAVELAESQVRRNQENANDHAHQRGDQEALPIGDVLCPEIRPLEPAPEHQPRVPKPAIEQQDGAYAAQAHHPERERRRRSGRGRHSHLWQKRIDGGGKRKDCQQEPEGAGRTGGVIHRGVASFCCGRRTAPPTTDLHQNSADWIT